MKSTQIKLAFFIITFIAIQLCSNSPPLAEGRFKTALKVVKAAFKPACAGCAGICERKVPGQCRCVVDQACMRKREL